MDESWFLLPGPSEAIRRILTDLDEGLSVVLCCPATVAGHWGERLRGADARASWIVPPASDLEEEPLNVIRRLAGYSLPVDMRQVIGDGLLRGRRIVIEVPTKGSQDRWAEWLALTKDWARINHAVELAQRASIVLLASGSRVELVSDIGGAAVVRYWRGVVDETDVLMYATQATRRSFRAPVIRRVAAGILASLAQWDGTVVDACAGCSLDELCNPMQPLRDAAHRRGWRLGVAAADARWYAGHCETIGGGERIHSYVLAVRDEKTAIARRVWSGQVGVLMPFVEERRQELVDILRRSLKVPFSTPFGAVMDRHDLEISHIKWQVTNRQIALPEAVRRSLSILVDIRHRLAHLEVVPAETLLSPEIGLMANGIVPWESAQL